MANNKWFGTDGVRGKANTFPMTIDFASKLGMAAGQLICTSKRRIAIAKDTRISGDMLEAALIAGFTSQGVEVIKLGVIPTPALTTLTPELNVDMSVMITASHNPYQDNGIKLISADGSKFSDDITAKIEALIKKNEFNFSSDNIGKVTFNDHAIQDYCQIALSISSQDKPLSGLKIVLDCANGCFYEILPYVFNQYGAQTIVLSNTPNGTNINLNCGSQHTANMCQEVINNQADLGIAVDGDGDRIIVCDEKGQSLDGDQIIAFLGQYFHNTHQLKGNTVVATIVSNPALDRFLNGLGINCVRSAVGERYVIEEMEKYGSNIGGEESGHMVLSDYSKTGDALMTGLVLAIGLKKSQSKMSQLFPLFTPMTCRRNDAKFKTTDEMKDAFENSAFKTAIQKGEQQINSKEKILIRKSGTEPKIQVWSWSDDVSLAEEINLNIISVLEQLNGFESIKKVR